MHAVGHIYVEVKDNWQESILYFPLWVLEIQLRLSGRRQVPVPAEALGGL